MLLGDEKKKLFAKIALKTLNFLKKISDFFLCKNFLRKYSDLFSTFLVGPVKLVWFFFFVALCRRMHDYMAHILERGINIVQNKSDYTDLIYF